MKYLFFFMLLATLKSFGQTKLDTQSWISSTINNYAREDIYNPTLQVYFVDGNIWFTEIENNYDIVQRVLPLKKLNNVTIVENNRGFTLILECRNGQTCCSTEHLLNEDGVAKLSYINDIKNTRIEIYLQKSLKDDDLNKRLVKAIKHIIKLNGGTVISNTF